MGCAAVRQDKRRRGAVPLIFEGAHITGANPGSAALVGGQAGRCIAGIDCRAARQQRQGSLYERWTRLVIEKFAGPAAPDTVAWIT